MDCSDIFYIFYIFEIGSVYWLDVNFVFYKISVIDYGKICLVKGIGIWIYLGNNNLIVFLSYLWSYDMEVCKVFCIW